MSKLDAQRAIREARYAANAASRPTPRAAAPVDGAAATPAPRTPAPRTPATRPARAAAAPEGERCGHRSMNGRECTREAAHAEKSHRYS